MFTYVFFLSCLGFLSGVLVHSLYFELEILPWGIFLLCFCVVFVVVFLKKKRLFIFTLCFTLGFLLGLVRFHQALPGDESTSLDYFAEEKIELNLTGRIITDPEYERAYSRFTIETEALFFDNETHSFISKIQVTTNPYTDLEFGDDVYIQGILEKPEAFETTRGRSFAYDTYLAKDGIFYLMSFAEIEFNSKQAELSLQDKFVRSLYHLKNKLISNINRQLPQPESGLLAGILFGKRDALDEHTNEQFRRVGLMHIVVLSGYNVSLVIQLMMGALRFLPLYIRSILAVLGIISFALLVGAGPTVIRASIMALFIVLAKILGRRYNVERALVVAAVIMVLMNPWILLFDLSFQLSFLATYGLISFSPYFEHWLRSIPEILELRSSAVATLSAQLAVTPLILYAIGDFSIVSPVVNTIVLFAVPWGMLFGFISSLSLLPEVISFLAYLPLKYILLVVDIFSELSLAVVSVPGFHVSIMILSYTLIYLWFLDVKKRFKKAEIKTVV